MKREQRLKIGEAFEYATATMAKLNALIGELCVPLLLVKTDRNFNRLSDSTRQAVATAERQARAMGVRI